MGRGGIDNRRVSRSGTAGRGFPAAAVLLLCSAAESDYEFPDDLIISDEKYWRVRAIGTDGAEGPWSDPWSFEIVPSTSPQVIATLDVGGGGYRIVLKDNYAYMARGVNGVSVVDISDRTAPALAGSITGIQTGHDLAVAGNYLYVMDNSAGDPKRLKVYDISNRTSPQPAATLVLDDPGSTSTYRASSSSFGFHGTSLFTPMREDNSGDGADYVIAEFDISIPTSPSISKLTAITDNGFDIAITGNIIVFSQGDTDNDDPGVGTLDIIGGGAPNLYSVPNMNSGFIEIYKSYACVSDLNGPVRIFDISNPSSPTPVSTFETGAGSSVGGVVGKYLYVGKYGSTEAYYVDISDITSPTTYSTLSEGLNMSLIEGNYGYGLDYTEPGTFYIIDLIPGD